MRQGHPLFRTLQLLLVSVFALVFFAPSLRAQVDTGTVLGTVTDQSGAVVPNAKVSLTNEGTGFTISTKTSGAGTYTFTPVKIGTYTVTVEASGFAKAIQSHLTLNIDQHLVVNMSLRPGAVTQTITVTTAPPALQTQNASLGNVVTGRNVNNLPLNGRNFTFLAQLVAGVNTPQADTRGNAASGAFSANGMRPAQNNYLLDGIDNNSDNVDFLNGTNYNVLPPVDAIAEFKVQTSNYSAQYGRAGGAILNATIKSGTNKIHGNVWEFLRNDKFDAADFFENKNGLKKGEFRQNQFGFTLGGPIKKNKVFVFGDYEALRRRQGSVFNTSVPTTLQRGSGYTDYSELITQQTGSAAETDDLGRKFPFGTILDPATTRAVTAGQVDPVTGLTATSTGYVRDPFYTGGSVGNITDFTGMCPSTTSCMLNQLPAGRLDQNAIKLLDLYPTPNNPTPFQNYASNPVLRENRNAFDTRVDYDVNESNQMFATFSYVKDPQYIPGPFKGIADGGAFQQGNQNALSILAAYSYTHIFSPTLVNEARVGESRLHATRFGPVANQMGIPEQYGISSSIPQVPENGGLPAFGISGLSTLGSNAFLPSDEISQTTQVTDNLTKIYGKHTFKMGIEYQHIKFSTLQPSWSHGQFNYDGTYTGIPDGQSGNTGAAQFLLLPCPGPTPGGTSNDCPSVSGAIPNLGGANNVYSSNIGYTDDGKNYYGAYFQDDWKFSPKLTLNLGLRWDYFGPIFEHYGAQANFVPSAPGKAEFLIPANRNKGLSPSFLALTAQDGINIVSSNNPGLINVQKTNFAPRVGFAYQATDKLVMRGGYGIFYNSFENQGYGPNIGENYPFQFSFHFPSPNGELPNGAASYPTLAGTPCENAFMFESGFDCTPLDTSLVQAEGLSLQGLQTNYSTPYTMGFNMMLQYAFTHNLTVTAGYVGNQVRHLQVGVGSNHVSQILPPGTNTKATSSPGVGLYLPFPDFGEGQSYHTTQGNSYYNSLQTSVQQRFANGLTFLAAYTYARCRSDATDLLNGGAVGYRAPDVPGFGIQGDYTDCNFDIRQTFHFSGGYQLPFGQGQHFLSNSTGVMNQVVSGWTMQWINTAETGQPLNINCANGTTSGTGCVAFIVPGQDRHGSGAPDNFLNAAAFTQPCQPGTTPPSPAGCIPGLTGLDLLGGGRGQTSGPGIVTFDFSLFKNFRISDRYNLQFRSEFFNVLNHPTFNAPGFGGNGVVAISGSTNFLSNNFGKIGATRFPFKDPRQIQFALKLSF